MMQKAAFSDKHARRSAKPDRGLTLDIDGFAAQRFQGNHASAT